MKKKIRFPALLLIIVLTASLLCLPASAIWENPFEDVDEAVSYYPAVMWAYYHEPRITNGVDLTHFAPENSVTRGQAVTFLWRTMNCPEPKTSVNPFSDVKETDYYYKPILWATENNITNGTDETHFTPGQICSTAHMVTFLFRTMNPDEVKKGNDGWYDAAADWCRSAGISEVYFPPVSPSFECTRGLMVDYLYHLSQVSSASA